MSSSLFPTEFLETNEEGRPKRGIFNTEEMHLRKKRREELKRANVKLAQMEVVTKTEMLKNHFGDKMVPNELQVIRHIRKGSSSTVLVKPCRIENTLNALRYARMGGSNEINKYGLRTEVGKTV